MFTNADCTIYFKQNGRYTRRAVENIFWSDSKQSNIIKTGQIDVDSVKVMIPIESANDLIFTTGEDIIIKGIQEFEFDNTDGKSISGSRKALEVMGKVYTITVADDKRYGSEHMHHYDLSCK